MNMKEALAIADNACRYCMEVKGRCCEDERNTCWNYPTKIALIRAIPEKPISKGIIETPTGKLEKLYCPSCNRRLKNDNRNRFCPRCGKAIDWDV